MLATWARKCCLSLISTLGSTFSCSCLCSNSSSASASTCSYGLCAALTALIGMLTESSLATRQDLTKMHSQGSPLSALSGSKGLHTPDSRFGSEKHGGIIDLPFWFTSGPVIPSTTWISLFLSPLNWGFAISLITNG